MSRRDILSESILPATPFTSVKGVAFIFSMPGRRDHRCMERQVWQVAIGHRIRTIRLNAGLAQYTLEQRLRHELPWGRIWYGKLGKIESGREPASLIEIAALSKILGVPTDSFVPDRELLVKVHRLIQRIQVQSEVDPLRAPPACPALHREYGMPAAQTESEPPAGNGHAGCEQQEASRSSHTPDTRSP